MIVYTRTPSSERVQEMRKFVDFLRHYPYISCLGMLLGAVALAWLWMADGAAEIQRNPYHVIKMADAYDTNYNHVWLYICDNGEDLCDRAEQGLEDGEGLTVIASVFSKTPLSDTDKWFLTWGRFIFAMTIPVGVASFFLSGKWEDYKSARQKEADRKLHDLLHIN